MFMVGEHKGRERNRQLSMRAQRITFPHGCSVDGKTDARAFVADAVDG